MIFDKRRSVLLRFVFSLLVLLCATLGTQAQTPTRLANIATRMKVLTGDNVLIGGFIVTGTEPKKVIIRGIGPSLSKPPTNLQGALDDPTLELHDANSTLAFNDNWQDDPSQATEINGSGIPPTDPRESAIVKTLAPGPYTVILRGNGTSTGIGVVEVYDLAPAANSQLANISSRGFVDTGDNVMIGGIIIVGSGSKRVIVRSAGPSLPVPNKLADPTLELYNKDGGLIASNDNWVDSPDKQAIIDSQVAPTNDSEPAIIGTLPATNHTAIVRGKNGITGVATVEAYALADASTPAPTLFIVNGGDATPANSSVTKSNLDGTGGASLGNIGGFLNAPQGIAINATAGKIYISNEGGDSITQSNLDGSSPVNMTFNGLLKGPYGVALDVSGNKIYIANGGNNTIVRGNLDGGSATSLGNLGGLLNIPQGMAINVSGNKMYVANQNSAVIQANLDGTGATSLNFGGLLAGSIPLDVALNVGGNRMYVVDFNGNLFSADLSGGNATKIGDLGGTLMAPRGMGLDVTGGKMYISNAMNNTVTRADLPDGANPVALTIATLNSPAVVAIYRAP
jgi:DNA-binding beta-propeller fold protein YncE